MQKARDKGAVRIIVRLAVGGDPDEWMESDILKDLRRADIRRGRDVIRSALAGLPHRVIRDFDDFPFVALSAGPESLRLLESMQGIVAEVVEDRLHKPALAQSTVLVQADQVWPGGSSGLDLDGTGTVIAVLDTGVDKNHAFLEGRVVEEACFSSNEPSFGASSVCPGGVESSFAPGSGMPCDMPECDHGTHVAGIAAGDGQDGNVAPFSGVAKGAQIMAVQVFTRFDDPSFCPFGCALAFTSDIMAGLQRVYNRRSAHNFAAVNMSLGGDPQPSNCDSDQLKSIIDTLRAAKIATVAASGNDFEPNGIGSPACISSVVSVGSTDDGSLGTTADEVSGFSNSASFLSLLAPGRWIESSIPGDLFDNFQGTSMATPHVAGAFAILKEAVPHATVNQMLEVLKSTGVPVMDSRNGIVKLRIRILNAVEEIPVLQFDSATYSVNESDGLATITVTRSGVAVDKLTVKYATSNGTATASSDYTAKSGTLTFNPGDSSKSFTIPIVNDTLDESDETINLTLSNLTGVAAPADLSSTFQMTAVLTIVDNDTAGSVQFSAASYNVSEAGGSATITVTRTGGAASGVTVNYATSNGTASAGSDYTTKTGTLTFGAGVTTQTFAVPITNDTLDEPSQTIDIALSNPTGSATLSSPDTAVLTILDNDGFRFSAATYTVAETRPVATVTVTRASAAGTASVDYATTGSGSAIAGADYTAVPVTTLTFLAGQTSKTFTVPIINDTIDEINETVNLALSNPSPGASLSTPNTAVLTITDNDVAGTLRFSLAAYSVAENVIGETTNLTVTRSGGAASGVTVNYAVIGGSATGGGTDYTLASGTLTFNAGVTSQTIPVTIVDDLLAEGNETVVVTLSPPTGGATLSTPNPATLTIVDDEIALHFKAATFTVSESSPTATITVIRSGPTGPPVTVDYATSNGSATAPADYTAVNGTLTFSAGQVSKTFTVPIINDTIDEANNAESVNLTLTNPSPVGIALLGNQDTAQLTINDNDVGGAFKFSAAAYTVAEGTATTPATAKITVTRTGGTAGGVTVEYATSNGTASNPADYSPTSGVLTFNSGVTSQTFTVAITHDTIDEPNETVILTLSNATGGATLGTPNPATLNITDNDVAGTIKFSTATYSLNETGGTATITVTRSGGAASAVTVQYATSNGSATAGSDYTAIPLTTLTFNAGETSKSFTVSINNDGAAEGNETVNLALSNVQGGATLATPNAAVLTIVDDEIALQFSLDAYTVTEAGTKATITVVRSGPSTSAVSVDYATSDNTATAGDDYTNTFGTLAFAAGQTTKTFTIPIINDTADEIDNNEIINLTLTNPTLPALLGNRDTAQLTIVDNDLGGTLKFSAATLTVAEGTATTAATATITVTRTGGTASGVTVDYATTDGSANQGVDYTPASGTLVFAAGQTSRTFTVPILHDTIDEINETVILTLSDATGGAQLGTPNPATLNIADND